MPADLHGQLPGVAPQRVHHLVAHLRRAFIVEIPVGALPGLLLPRDPVWIVGHDPARADICIETAVRTGRRDVVLKHDGPAALRLDESRVHIAHGYRPLLVNSSMYRIIHSAFKSDYFDVNKLTEYYKNGEFKKGTEIVSIKGNRFLKLSDNTVWKIVENNLTVNAKPIHEVIAYNTTGLYNKYVELDMRNRHLEEVNRRLREYIDNVYTTIREDEILAAKIRVHDDVGRTLLALRSYISHENGDRNQLLELWNFTVSVLKRENVSTDCETTLDSLIKAGGAVGVSLEFDGDLPESERYGGLINHAIHECLTNTVKHADGTLLSIKTIYENGEYRIEFTNNGKSPLVPIRETGGLKNLRNEAESCGAKMNTETKPRFKLILSFKEV